MPAIHSRPAGPPTGWAWGAPVEASAAILEAVYQVARTRLWIDVFIGPLAESRKGHGDDR